MKKSTATARWARRFVAGLLLIFVAGFLISWYYAHETSAVSGVIAVQKEKRASMPSITLVGAKQRKPRAPRLDASPNVEDAYPALPEAPPHKEAEPETRNTPHSHPRRESSHSIHSRQAHVDPPVSRSRHTHLHTPRPHTPAHSIPDAHAQPGADGSQLRGERQSTRESRAKHTDEPDHEKEEVATPTDEEEQFLSDAAIELDDSGAGGRPTSLSEASARRASLPVCGGMPPSMLPNFTYQSGTRKNNERRLPGKSGYVGVSGLYNKPGSTARTRTENGPRQTRIESTKKPQVRDGEDALVDCLENLAACSNTSRTASHTLKPVQQALMGSSLGLKERYKTCAIVGNSGGMLLQEYGSYIDTHDAVIRINVLENTKYSANLGTAAHFRVLSYKMGKDVCCIMPKEKHPPDNPHLTYLVWFPANREELAGLIRKRYKNPVKVLPNDFLAGAVASFKGMRSELVRMGFGPFEDWEFITSGMHAVLAFARSCDSLNLYGFTTDVGAKQPYWFTGRNVAPRSGRTQHAWDHERMILRLLHAAGLVNICTT
mmetsp:Transcript_41111/g.68821  ORF Transcript_41111/g.68821 Transcript_41111/m.68821 type:complete len:546 (+) Transcript_41111:321-1958(+)